MIPSGLVRVYTSTWTTALSLTMIPRNFQHGSVTQRKSTLISFGTGILSATYVPRATYTHLHLISAPSLNQFRILDKNEVPSGAISGVAFTTVSLNPEIYLPWLKGELEARGVQFIRKRVYSIGEAAAIAGPKGVLVNATGLGARSLIGVQDTAVYPIRGQTILAYVPSVQEFLSYPLGLSALSLSYVNA